MLTEWELWACANELIRRHGENANIHAAMRADELLEQGDLDGAANFRAIVDRVKRLLTAPQGALH